MWDIDEIFEETKEILTEDQIFDMHITDGQLKLIIKNAIGIFLDLKYPSGNIPLTADNYPMLDFRALRWIKQATVEMASRQGVQGQVRHNENSIDRSYDSGSISLGLIRQITPVVGFDNSIDTRFRVIIPDFKDDSP